MMTAFELTESQRYVLEAMKSRQASNGWVFMPAPNNVWLENINSLIGKGFIVRDENPDYPMFYKILS